MELIYPKYRISSSEDQGTRYITMKDIHGEERFKKLMERVKKEWEHFEV
jgi:enoyl-[acyl-carrier-protein] reductase (NADH)